MYCTINDILKSLSSAELISLVNDEKRTSVNLADPTDACTIRINEQISLAGEEIDGYLRSRYALPFAATPVLVRTIALDISIYNLYKRRNRLDLPDSLVKIYTQRKAELKDIQRGENLLDVPKDDLPTMASEVAVNKTATDRIFPKEVLDQF